MNLHLFFVGPEAVESRHSFSSGDDNHDEKQGLNDLKGQSDSVERGVHKSKSEQYLGKYVHKLDYLILCVNLVHSRVYVYVPLSFFIWPQKF